jgi:hypothetical protein
MVAAAVVGAGLGSAFLSSQATKSAASNASSAQQQSAQFGIDQQNKQFDAVQKLLSPFVTAGTGALSGQQDLLGTNGVAAQQSAIAALQASPQYQALSQSGQDSILANASATGGLRGGNTQSALAQFQPALLSSLIDQQYSRLGGLTSLGQNAAAGVGNAGMQTGNNISTLLGQQGAAQAGSALAAGRSQAGLYNAFGKSAGMYQALQGFGGTLGYDATAARAATSAAQSAPITGLGAWQYSPTSLPSNLPSFSF